MKILTPLFPLTEQLHLFPQSAFGVERKYDVHCGVDIYCQENTGVFAPEAGVVESIELFTGPEVNSPWWHTTYAVIIKKDNIYYLYGELIPDAHLKVKQVITAGERIGQITPVLKKDKGINPRHMLHFEMYSALPWALTWEKGQSRPSNLLDPTDFLHSHL